ncbi:hypothetical protein [Streptomyces sp. NPDC058572]|uniref:hypothetical protein n=1 Tax=Streptomyces sp. NPDC058572 TaxID=3346546 RepID=UPI00365C8B50
MSASEREPQSHKHQSSHEPAIPMPVRPLPSTLSMRELLASCAAATAVSTPPREHGPEHRPEHRVPRRDAA